MEGELLREKKARKEMERGEVYGKGDKTQTFMFSFHIEVCVHV